jgi:hypothetical protein
MDLNLDFDTRLKHVMFLRPLSLYDLKQIIQIGKFSQPVQINSEHLIWQGQIMKFRFGPNDDSEEIIGMESNIINLEDYDKFYAMAEYIGKYQIKFYGFGF